MDTGRVHPETLAGDPFAAASRATDDTLETHYASLERPDHDELRREYWEQLREMERQRGRQLLPSEVEDFTRAFYAPHYKADLVRIPKAAWYEFDRELEAEERDD